MRTQNKITVELARALEHLGANEGGMREYYEECYAAVYKLNEPIRWPYSQRARKALTRLLIACGMNPGLARQAAGKMNLKQMLRVAKRAHKGKK